MPRRFIDTHAHFWDPDRIDYPWFMNVPTISSAHTPATLYAEASPHAPEKIVFVEADCDRSQAMDETAWVDSLVAKEPRVAAIVAHATMDVGNDTTAMIEKLATRPIVHGVRHLTQNESDPAYCARKEFIAGVRQLPAHNLSFDICCFHFQLPSVIQLIRSCPDTSFILDHAGKPDIRTGALDPWREHMATVAGFPNVVCKFSGMITEASHESWQTEDLVPYTNHLIEIFGPGRLIFGSDWPVAKLAGSYVRWLETADTLLAHLSAYEQDAVFHENARRVYRLD
jgi:L-fuconolactonase